MQFPHECQISIKGFNTHWAVGAWHSQKMGFGLSDIMDWNRAHKVHNDNHPGVIARQRLLLAILLR